MQGKVQFVFVYCQEFHPHQEVGGPSAKAGTIRQPLKQSAGRADREERARDLSRWSESRARRILVDEDGPDGSSLVQDAYHAYANARTFIVDRRGRIVWMKSMAEAADVEKALGELFPELVSPPASVGDSN